MTEFDNIRGTVLPYDQAEIETVMKQIMYANGITDVMYEGSNVSQLTSIISYVIASLNANTAINLQETILPLATKRMNILFGARQLGYEPHAVKSYKYELLLKPQYDKTKTIIDGNGNEIIDTNNKEDRTISLVHNTMFRSGDKFYYYVGPTLDNAITVNNFDIQYINDTTQGRPFDEITLKIPVVEGIMTTHLEDEMLIMEAKDYIENGETKTKQDFLVGYTNVEEDYGLQVYLTYTDDDGYIVVDEEWTKSEQLLVDETLDYNKRKYVRKENIILGYPAIFFKFAGLGNGVRTGTIIKVNVLQSSGADGEAMDKFYIVDGVFSEEMEVIEYNLLEKGRGAETDKEIKDNAIVFKNTGNRAVTRYDYIAISKRYPLVAEADAWGGEEENPKEIGNIWLSCTPEDSQKNFVEYETGYKLDIGTPSKDVISNPVQKNFRNWYLIDDEYKQFFNYLDTYKIMTMQLNYRQPLYVNFDYTIDIVKYDMTKSVKTINSIVFRTLNQFFTDKIEKYDTEYLSSNVQRILDTVLDYKAGVNISLSLSGTLCSDMIDKFNKEKYNKNIIINHLSMPYEDVLNSDRTLVTDRLPRIDGNFGVSGGSIIVDYEMLNAEEQMVKFIRTADIYYCKAETDCSFENGTKIGTYNVDTEKLEIELVWDFDLVTLDEIFGEEKDDGYGPFRQYTEFQINYYPYDNNLVNVMFNKNSVPRLRTVEFTTV